MSLFRPALIVVIWFGVVDCVTGQVKTEPAAPQKQTARVDFQGDPLPADVLVRLGSTRLRHGFYAKDVAFSPDGTMVASAGYDHAVRLWDVATGKELRRFTSESVEAITNSSARWFHCLAFSPDGKRLACGEYFEAAPSSLIRIWDVATGKVLDAMDGGNGGVPSIAYSPDGATLASCGRDGTVHLWDNTGKQKQVLAGHKGAVRSVAWSRKGDMLVTGSDDTTIRLWDSATGRELGQLQGHKLAVESVNFSPDGKRIVSGSKDLTIRLWDTSTGKEQGVLGRHERVVFRVAFSPDGKTVASASGDKAIKLWDVSSGKMAGILEGHCKDVCGLAFSPDGKTLASISDDHKLGLWDLATRKELHPQPGHQDSNMGLVFLEKGEKLLTIGKDDTIRWWDWRTGKEERSISWPILRTARATCISPAGDLVAVASRDGGLLVLETKSGKELGRPGDGKRPVIAADLSHDSRFLAYTLGKGVALWDVAKQKPAGRIATDVGNIEFLLFAPSGKLLVGGGNTSYLWDVAQDKQVGRELQFSFIEFKSAVFLPDSRHLACGDMSGKAQLWNIETMEKVRTFTTNELNWVSVLAVSPDHRLLIGGYWRGIKVWEIETGLERRGYRDFDGATTAVALSPNGRALAAGVGAQQVLIWDHPGLALSKAPQVAGPDAHDLWDALATSDGGQVHRAIWGLASRPAESMPYIKTKLKPASMIDGARLAAIIENLDSDVFTTREQATKDLHDLGDLVEPMLRNLVDKGPSLEVKRRAKSVLDQLASTLISPQRMQSLRAIEALEHMGTAEARALLLELARGAAEARSTREAAAALERMKKH